MDYINASFTQNHYYNNNYNNVSIDEYQNDYNSTYDDIFCWYFEEKVTAFTMTIISIWVSLTPLAIYCLYSKVRSDRVIPVFIINLLISDFIQVCCMIVHLAMLKNNFTDKLLIAYNAYNCGVMASVFFMTFISMERYLLIVWPLWYRFQQKLKISASISVVSWILSIYIGFNNGHWLGALMALPIPLLIFFLVQTFKALSTSQNVPPLEKCQIMAILTLVLFIYTLNFIPQIIAEFLIWLGLWWDSGPTVFKLMSISCTLIQLNPVTDLLLYIPIKKWVSDKLVIFLSCCRKTKDVHQQTNSITTTTCSWSASQSQTEAENIP